MTKLNLHFNLNRHSGKYHWYFLQLLFSLLFATQMAQAHVIGNAAWCRTNSPFHFECYFDEEAACKRYNKMLKDPSAEWTCDVQPTDPEIRNAKDLQTLIKQKK